MQYRLEAITRQAAHLCDLCGRRHRTVVIFREVSINVPSDPALPVQVTDGATTLVVGTGCARKLLDKIPVAYLGEATRLLDAAHL